MKFKAYHKIKQFKDVIRDITYKANFKGLDENDEPIYEQSEKPVLTFKGSVKLHGTNAGVSYLPSEGILAQKRSSLLSLDNLASHFTFNQFVQVTAKEWLTDYMELMHLDLKCSDKEQITIYGEWAGTKVQQSVGISELPKAFYVFEDAKVYNTETEEERWVKVNPVENDFKIYFLSLFKTWEVEIDFNNPGLVQ